MHLSKNHPNIDFSIIMGEDNLSILHKWKNYKDILDYYELYVYPRCQFYPGSLNNHKKVHFVDAPMMQISSTLIRDRIKNKKNVRMMLHKDVWEYIDDFNLYEK